MGITKTNAMRLLENTGVPFETAVYDVSSSHEPAEAVAARLQAEPETVFKTLVAQEEGGQVFVFCLPAGFDLDLKKAAAAAAVKKISLIHLRDLQPLTGYTRGGCSPLAMKKQYPTFIDETAQLHSAIYVNGGARGLQILVAPIGLAQAAQAVFADVIKV